MSYQPTTDDKQWAKLVLSLVTDGGKWVFPNAMLIYTISHERKTVTLENPYRELNADQKEMHHRGAASFAAVGYKVLPEETLI
jgi:hypothetical protein